MISPTYALLFYSVLYNIYVLLHGTIYIVYLVNYAVLLSFHILSNALLFILYALNRKALEILKKK
jgi:hypothetical protein